MVLAVFLAVPEAATPALIQIGSAGAVTGRVNALAPAAGAVGRILSSGKLVYHKDKISTGPHGRTQLMLKDETVFTIGPDSEMMLDEFVYDPFTDTGKVTAKVTKGVFRFVTGKIARKKPAAMKIKLPTGTMGIRGTMAGGRVQGNTALLALYGPGANNNAGEPPGAVSVESGGVSVDLTQPGFATKLTGAGQPPTPPFRMTPQQQASLSTAPPPEPGGDSGPGGGQSASAASGQNTAGAAGTLADTESTGDVAANVNDFTDDAAQDQAAITDGPATWDELYATTLQGAGSYGITGSYSCSGACSGTSLNTYEFDVDVDFTQRSITNVYLYVRGPVSQLGESAGLQGAVPFGSGGGTAQVTFTAPVIDNPNFNGSNITFWNASGVAGQQAELDLRYDNGSSQVVAGTAKGMADFEAGGGG